MPNKNKKKSLVASVQAALVAAGHVPATAAVATTPEQPKVDDTPQVTASEGVGFAEPEAEGVGAAVTDDGDVVISNDMIHNASVTTAKLDKSKVKTEDLVQGEARDELIDILKAQIKEKDGELLEAAIEIRDLRKQYEALEASVNGLKAIAVKSINAMSVALNKKVADYTDKTAAEVLAAHQDLSEDFAANFKVGGVAAVEPEPAPQTKPVVRDSNWAARIKATSI